MSAIREQLYYLWKKLAERQSRNGFENNYFKDDIDRYKAYKDRKPQSVIKREMKALQNYWDCFPFQYYRFNFYRNDCKLSLEEMKQYVPQYFIFNLFYPLSAKEYGILCEDKLLNFAMLKTYAIPQPGILFFFDNNKLYNNTNTPLSPESAEQILSTTEVAKLFIKPRFGIGGKGIFVFTKKGNTYIDEKETVLDLSFFERELKNDAYVIQEGLVQSETINRIYPGSVNTFRIVTECSNGEVRILYTILRMGSGGQQVDNASSGGLYTKVDNTGMLGDFAYTTNQSVFFSHPDTGFVFKGATIENWEDARALAIAAALRFREIKYLGWDVAITINGPVIIELNHRPGVGIIQDWYGGIRDDLKINPKDWWYKSNYTLKNI